MVTCIGPAQDQARHNSSTDGGGAHMEKSFWKTHPQLQSYWQRMAAEGGRITLLWKLLVSCPHPSGWPHTHAHMGSSNWTQWVINLKNKDMRLGGRCVVGFLRGRLSGWTKWSKWIVYLYGIFKEYLFNKERILILKEAG